MTVEGFAHWGYCERAATSTPCHGTWDKRKSLLLCMTIDKGTKWVVEVLQQVKEMVEAVKEMGAADFGKDLKKWKLEGKIQTLLDKYYSKEEEKQGLPLLTSLPLYQSGLKLCWKRRNKWFVLIAAISRKIHSNVCVQVWMEWANHCASTLGASLGKCRQNCRGKEPPNGCQGVHLPIKGTVVKRLLKTTWNWVVMLPVWQLRTRETLEE